MLVNESQHTRNKLRHAERFSLEHVSRGTSRKKSITYHNFVHAGINARVNLTSAGVRCYTADGYMLGNFLQLFEFANASSTGQPIHDWHLHIE
jgi:hypothetical protein